MAKVNVSEKAQKELSELTKDKQYKILKRISFLKENPIAGKKLDGDLKGRYSLRAWPYRIIYVFDQKNKIVEISHILHRQGVYK